MSHEHTLGRLSVKAGEILTFTYRDNTPQERHITVVAIADIDLSREMALFCEQADRHSHAIFTEEALPAFIEHLTQRQLLHVGNEISIDFGRLGRPASRLMNEYRFRINPEAFWEAKLLHRYQHNAFTLLSHQNHLLTLMAGVDTPFSVLANVLDIQGNPLGTLRLELLSDNRHTLINDEDIERIRLALQADITLTVQELSVMIDSIKVIPNPEFGINSFTRHVTPTPTSLSKPHSSIEEPVNESAEP